MEGISIRTEVGNYMLKLQDDLAEVYKYKRLGYSLSIEYMRKYVLSLPKGFHLDNDGIPVAENPEINEIGIGFEIIKKRTFPIVSRCGTLIASTFDRIVIGHYGAFIEIDDDDVYIENVKVKKGQEYRKTNKYKDKVKYYWFTAKDNSDCKLYYQKRGVTYADYRAGKWYISPFEVLDLEELTNFLLNSYEEEDL